LPGSYVADAACARKSGEEIVRSDEQALGADEKRMPALQRFHQSLERKYRFFRAFSVFEGLAVR
jgi:hypothetical protein